MTQLRYENGKFCYGHVPVTISSMRQIVRKKARDRAEKAVAVSIQRQRRAFEIIAERQGW